MSREHTIPSITVDPESGSSTSKQSIAPSELNNHETKMGSKQRPILGRILQSTHWQPPIRHTRILTFLPPQIFVYTCIFLLFSVTFICFYLSLSTVTSHEAEENEIHKLEGKMNQYSIDFDIKLSRVNSDKLAILKNQKSKFLSLVVITLVSFPFHIFGMVAVTKKSFTLTLTYSIISFILLCLQLKTNLSIDGHYLTLWFIEFALFALASLYCARLYCEKIRNVTNT